MTFLLDELLVVQILTQCPGPHSFMNECSAALVSKYHEIKSNVIHELLCRLIRYFVGICECSTSSKCARCLLLCCLTVHHFASFCIIFHDSVTHSLKCFGIPFDLGKMLSVMMACCLSANALAMVFGLMPPQGLSGSSAGSSSNTQPISAGREGPCVRRPYICSSCEKETYRHSFLIESYTCDGELDEGYDFQSWLSGRCSGLSLMLVFAIMFYKFIFLEFVFDVSVAFYIFLF